MTRALVILVGALALVSVAGCAGSEARLTHQEYEQEMQRIASDLQARAGGMDALASAPSQHALADLLREVGELMDEAADRVGDINPPEEIEEPHGVLADSLAQTGDLLNRAADRASDGDFFGAMAILEEAPDDLASDVREAISEIRTAGYYIGDNDDWG